MSKLLFSNTIGKIYDDKIVVDKEKYGYSRILSMRVLEQKNSNPNILFFALGGFALFLANKSVANNPLFYTCLVFCTIFTIIAVLVNKKDYYFILSLTVGTELEVRIKSKNEEEARTFLKIAFENKEKFR